MPIKKLKRLLSSPGTMTAEERRFVRYRQKRKTIQDLDDMKLILDSEDKLKPWLQEQMKIRNMNTEIGEKLTESTPDDIEDTDDGLGDDERDTWENPSSILGD